MGWKEFVGYPISRMDIFSLENIPCLPYNGYCIFKLEEDWQHSDNDFLLRFYMDCWLCSVQ